MGVPSSCETSFLRLHALAHASPHSIAILLDVSNAFNSISRDALFAGVDNLAPCLLPYTASVYGQPNTAAFRSGDAAFPIYGEGGAEQGDALGPTLFSLALRAPPHQPSDDLNALLKTLPPTEGGSALQAYLDDLGAILPSALGGPFLRCVERRLHMLGPTLATSKTQLWNAAGEPPARRGFPPSVFTPMPTSRTNMRSCPVVPAWAMATGRCSWPKGPSPARKF